MKVTDNKKKIVHWVSDIIISLMVFAVGILFAISCYSIYKSAETQMFTYDSIGEAFGKIDIIVYIVLAHIAAGAVLLIVFPREEVKLKTPKRIKKTYRSLSKRVDVSELTPDIKSKILRERKLRSALFIASAAVLVLEAFLPLIYLFNPMNFQANTGKYNTEVLNGFLVYLCMLLPVLIYETVRFIVVRFSYIRETEFIKEAMKNGAKAPTAENESEKAFSKMRKFFHSNEKPITAGIRIALIGCAVLFIVLGVVNGGMVDVLIKAVNICAECIGLG